MSSRNAKYNKPEWIGKKFNLLTVIKPIGIDTLQGKKWVWLCECDCGYKKIMQPQNILSGRSKTCGDYRKHRIIHGETTTKLYEIWRNMKNRCKNGKTVDKNYFGRGIKVCEEWEKYENFAKWAVENGYKDGLSIERIDNDGNYCPANCKWIEPKLQTRNKRTTHWVEYQGKKMPLVEVCEITGMPYHLVHTRIHRLNWSLEDAITFPVKPSSKNWHFKKKPQNIV